MKEYKLTRVALTGRLASGAEDFLNDVAREGWEMKFVVQATGHDFYALFEREIAADQSMNSVDALQTEPKKRGRPRKEGAE